MRIADYRIDMDAASIRREQEEKTTRIGIQTQTTSLAGSPLQRNGGSATVQQDRVDISWDARQSFAQCAGAAFESWSVVNDPAASSTQILQERAFVETLTATVLEQQGALSLSHTAQSEIQPQLQSPNSDLRTPSMPQTGAFLAQNTSMTATIHTREVKMSDEQLGVQASGVIQTQDGRTIDFGMNLLMQRSSVSITEQSLTLAYSREAVDMTDPLVLQLSGSLPELSHLTFAFDLNNDGHLENISMLKQGSAFLSLDKNSNGRIDSGNELFGPASGNGFADLAAHDSDGNNWIDENDAVFESLRLWFKDDTGQDVLKGLKEMGIGAIYLGSAAGGMTMANETGDTLGQVRQTGFYVKEDGSVKTIQQIDLASQSLEEAAPEMGPDGQPLFQNAAPGFENSAAELDQLNAVQQNLQRNINETRRSMDEHLSGRNKKKAACTPVERLIQMMENFRAKTHSGNAGELHSR